MKKTTEQFFITLANELVIFGDPVAIAMHKTASLSPKFHELYNDKDAYVRVSVELQRRQPDAE